MTTTRADTTQEAAPTADPATTGPPADPATTARPPLPTASARETAQVLGATLAPILAQGVIARRPRVVGWAGRVGTDDRGVAALQRLRDRHGDGPVRLPIPGRPAAVVLGAQDVARVLSDTPEPFATATAEKRGALGHFQPRGVLLSHGAARDERRRFTETVLDTGSPMHAHAASITRVVRAEAAALREDAAGAGVLDWKAFIGAWWRVVRRIVLGDHAREDHALTDRLTTLRRSANWSFLAPRREGRRRRLHGDIARHLHRAAPPSLAEMIARSPAPHQDPGETAPDAAPVDQVAHWLFAFDPAGAVTLRALALLASDAALRERVRDETCGRDLDQPQELPVLRAVVQESVRLWPTTPLLLRETTRPTTFGASAPLPAGTAIIIPTWFLHRDDRTRADSDHVAVDKWLDGSAAQDPMLTPFSAGPGVCPGRELVLFTASTMLAALLEDHHHVLLPPQRYNHEHPLPRGLDPYTLRFAVGRRGPGES